MCRAPYIIKILRGGGHCFKCSCIQVFMYFTFSHILTHILIHPHTHTHTDDNSKLSCSSDQGSGYPANEEPVISVH